MGKSFMACVFLVSVFMFGFVSPAALAEEPENPWIHATRGSFESPSEPTVGMPMRAFFKGRPLPDKREIRNGEEVMWFDGDEPYYAVFRNKKLTSYYVDKDTIARRAEGARRYDEELRQGQENFERAQYEAQAQERIRRQNAIRAMGNMFQPQPIPYQIPVNRPVNTNCQRFGNQVNCTSY